MQARSRHAASGIGLDGPAGGGRLPEAIALPRAHSLDLKRCHLADQDCGQGIGVTNLQEVLGGPVRLSSSWNSPIALRPGAKLRCALCAENANRKGLHEEGIAHLIASWACGAILEKCVKLSQLGLAFLWSCTDVLGDRGWSRSLHCPASASEKLGA